MFPRVEVSDAKFMGIDTNVTRFDKKKSAPLRWNGSDIDLPLVSPFWVILDILGSQQR